MMRAILSTLASLPAAFAAAQSSEAPATTHPLVLPGGIVDDAGQVLYLTDHGAKVVAVAAEDGDVLWESDGIARPLVVLGERLLALRGGKGRFTLVVLDARTGKPLAESEPVVFPLPEIVTGLDQGASFSARAWLTGGDAFVEWFAMRHREVSGVRHKDERSAERATGIQRVVLGSSELSFAPHDGPSIRRPGGTSEQPLNKLPYAVQQVALREGWESATLLGERAYGRSSASRPATEGASLVTHTLHALDLRNATPLWQRAYEQWRVDPPGMPRP